MEDREILQKAAALLIAWYAASRRILPWREAPTPYHIWISEIMLQQTRIEAVIPYYERFLRELPDLASLAAVDEDRLMKLWEGLGYYSRARNLRKAAKQIMSEYGGELPRRAEELKKLPGIGDYTAGAIASVAYGEPELAVDGNVMRVLSRLLAFEDDVMEQKTRRRITEQLRAIYPVGEDAALLTEGIMELGETVCIPNGEARCGVCPLRTLCRAHADDSVERYPVKAPPRARRVEARTVLLLRCGDRWAIRRRPNKGLLAGLWEFPSKSGALSAQEAAACIPGSVSCTPCGEAAHVFTHVEWHMCGYVIDCAEMLPDCRWVTAAQLRDRYSVPTALRYYQKVLDSCSKEGRG
jgi:A/G-specific adenine glycosylase